MASYPTRTPGPLGPLEDRVRFLEKQLRTVTSPTAEQYAQAVASLNTVDSTEGSSTGAGQAASGAASGEFFEWVTMYASVAAGKNRIDGVFIATAVMVDTTSGGGATLSMRLVTRYPDGSTEYSPTFQAAKNAGASAVNNVVVGNTRVSRTNLPVGTEVEVGIQVAATNPAAFPANSGNVVQGSGIFVCSNRI